LDHPALNADHDVSTKSVDRVADHKITKLDELQMWRYAGKTTKLAKFYDSRLG